MDPPVPETLASLHKAKAPVTVLKKRIFSLRTSRNLQSNKDTSLPKLNRQGQWTQANMDSAIMAVQKGIRMRVGAAREKLGIRAAAQRYYVPYETLRRRLKGPVGKHGRPTQLTSLEEFALVEWIVEMSDRGLSAGKAEVIEKAKKMFKRRKKRRGINRTPFKGGKDWWKGFRGRWSEISMRKSQALDKGRAAVMSKEIVASFYDSLQQVYLELPDLTGERIFNCDESSFVAGTMDGGYFVLCIRGARRAYRRAVSNRENVTVMSAISASGFVVPEMYIFKGARLSHNYVEGARKVLVRSCRTTVGSTRTSSYLGFNSSSTEFLEV